MTGMEDAMSGYREDTERGGSGDPVATGCSPVGGDGNLRSPGNRPQRPGGCEVPPELPLEDEDPQGEPCDAATEGALTLPPGLA